MHTLTTTHKWYFSLQNFRGRKQCCKLHYCLWRVSIKPETSQSDKYSLVLYDLVIVHCFKRLRWYCYYLLKVYNLTFLRWYHWFVHSSKSDKSSLISLRFVHSSLSDKKFSLMSLWFLHSVLSAQQLVTILVPMPGCSDKYLFSLFYTLAFHAVFRRPGLFRGAICHDYALYTTIVK